MTLVEKTGEEYDVQIKFDKNKSELQIEGYE